MKHLFKPLKTRTGNTDLLSECINVSILCAILFFPHYLKAADNYYNNDTINIDRVYLYTSFYTQHLSPDDEHVNDQDMLGMELRMTNKWMYGLAMFKNSFGQDTEYLYAGYKWGVSDSFKSRTSYQYLKLTGGLMHGYKDEYEDKIPFNGLGVAPAVVPTYGYQEKNFLTEVSLGGVSVVAITVGYIF